MPGPLSSTTTQGSGRRLTATVMRAPLAQYFSALSSRLLMASPTRAASTTTGTESDVSSKPRSRCFEMAVATQALAVSNASSRKSTRARFEAVCASGSARDSNSS